MNKEEKNPEQTPTEGDDQEEVVTVKKAEYEQMAEKANQASQLESEKSNLVSEIKDLRKKNQLTESEKEELANKVNRYEQISDPQDPKSDDLTPERISEVVKDTLQRELSEREKAEREASREAALEEFKNTHKEFHDENDEGGIKFSAFQRQLSRFNLDGLKTEADFKKAFEDAYYLLNKDKAPQQDDQITPEVSTPSGEGRDLKETDSPDKSLSDKEKKVIQQMGWTAERYLAQREKRPDMVRQLLDSTTI